MTRDSLHCPSTPTIAGVREKESWENNREPRVSMRVRAARSRSWARRLMHDRLPRRPPYRRIGMINWRQQFHVFVNAVAARLERGHETYGDDR